MSAPPLHAVTARVLEEDPHLGRDLRARDFGQAAAEVTAPVVELLPGADRPEVALRGERGCLGWLVLDGIAAREVAIDGSAFTELLGPGDVLCARDLDTGDDAVRHEVSCVPLTPMRLAFLDRRFTTTAGRWPELLSAVADRLAQRADRLALGHAVSGVSGVERRLLLALWLLVDRWGHPTDRGIRLDLKLSHRMIGQIIGARRPTVTKAFRELEARGFVRRLGDDTFLLPPATEIAGLRADARPAAGSFAAATGDGSAAAGGVLRGGSFELGPADRLLTLAAGSSAMLVLDRELRLRAWNAAAAELFGLGPDARDQSLLDLGSGLPAGELVPRLRRCLDGSPERRETLIEATDAGGAPVRCSITCAPLGSGAQDGIVLLADVVAG